MVENAFDFMGYTGKFPDGARPCVECSKCGKPGKKLSLDDIRAEFTWWDKVLFYLSGYYEMFVNDSCDTYKCVCGYQWRTIPSGEEW